MPRKEPTRVTIVDVAHAAGVAISSASTALNGQPGVSSSTRERVKAVADQLGYVPSARARSLSSRRAFAVGLVVERDFDVLETDPFFGAFMGGIEESLAPRGYLLALQLTQDADTTVKRHGELARARRVDGLFLNEIKVGDRRVDALLPTGVPVVGVNADDEDFPFPAVRQDGTDAIGELVRTLADLGHTRIAHVSGTADYVHSRARRRAWSAAMLELGLRPDMVVDGSFTSEGGRRAAEVLLTRPDPPTAVFCANDLSAIGFMNRAAELGVRVPDDISVAGFDGNSIDELVRPALTTVRTSPRQLGREAARILLAAIDGESPDSVRLAPARLVVRGSIARARRSERTPAG